MNFFICEDAAGAAGLTVGDTYRCRDIDRLNNNATKETWLEVFNDENKWEWYLAHRFRRIKDPVEAVPVESIKESNPKDSIGVRKVPLSCVPASVMLELGLAMQEGSYKYRRHNYRAIGVRASVYYDATMRHMMSWWEGEDEDPDSNVSHVTKAIASLTVLRDAMIQKKFHDDRPPKSVPFVADLNSKAAALADRYAANGKPPYTALTDE